MLLLLTEAVPKRILDLMNVEGLTRENVASHLQVCNSHLTFTPNRNGAYLGNMSMCCIRKYDGVTRSKTHNGYLRTRLAPHRSPACD